MIDQPKQYPELDPETLGDDYFVHLSAMTTENLYEKADIAAQLAWRDIELRKLRALREACEARDKAFDAGKGYYESAKAYRAALAACKAEKE